MAKYILYGTERNSLSHMRKFYQNQDKYTDKQNAFNNILVFFKKEIIFCIFYLLEECKSHSTTLYIAYHFRNSLVKVVTVLFWNIVALVFPFYKLTLWKKLGNGYAVIPFDHIMVSD